MMEDAVRRALVEARAYYCLSCGKCTASCPVARHEAGFSPRRLVESVLEGHAEEALAQGAVWGCLTCLRCEMLCPSGVRLGDFVRAVRGLARTRDLTGLCTHGGAIEAWMRIMARGDHPQRRLDWLWADPSLEAQVWPPLSSQGEGDGKGGVLFFVGCLPYYQVLFADLGIEADEMARDAVRVLNHLGVRPVVLADERCCGHDLLWQGDFEGFARLARKNLDLIAASGAEQVVTLCPECYRTLARDYPALGGRVPPVVHLSEWVTQAVREGRASLGVLPEARVTYHDPCRLGRHMGVYEAPRFVLQSMGLELAEMAHSRGAALCCGTSAWTHCGATSKAIQVDRLGEARATGADLLVTACPKCQIHLRCAMKDLPADSEVSIPIRDWVSLVAAALMEEKTVVVEPAVAR
ncbi:MAG: (Fe-S)-binding protein [Anaerolineae bacterium]